MMPSAATIQSPVESPVSEKHSATEEVKVNFATYRPVPETTCDIEVEYATTVFPLEGERKLHVRKPLRFGYMDEAGTVEIIGWGLKVKFEDAIDLPVQIARRFLELFSRTQAGDNLGEQDEACFATICEQIDYRRFCAERDLPRYHEALLVRKNPPLIRMLSEKNIRLSPAAAASLNLLKDGDYFGAYFTWDRQGEIQKIEHICFVPSPNSVLADFKPEDFRALPGDFPESLMSLLPKSCEAEGDCPAE